MPTRTLSTLVAVFRTDADARSAADDLKANGFNSGDIFITAENDPARVASGTPTHEYRQHEGGIKGWFHSVFGEGHDANYDRDAAAASYESAVSSGNVLLSVETNENNLETAAEILNRHSPVDVHRDAASHEAVAQSQVPGTLGNRSAVETVRESSREADQGAIPVVQEELRVGKQAILRGGVRVYSRLVEHPVEETVRLREEHVRVDRTPVNREVSDADLRRGKEQVIEVKEFAEEAVVSKTARVVEEVRIHKDATERDETVRDTLRRTEVEVENIGEGSRDRAGVTAGTTYGDANYTNDFRRDYEQRYAASGEPYDTYAPAYDYGYTMANDPRYRGRSFDEIEPDLRNDYAQRYPNSTWERMKDSVRYGWDRLTQRNRV